MAKTAAQKFMVRVLLVTIAMLFLGTFLVIGAHEVNAGSALIFSGSAGASNDLYMAKWQKWLGDVPGLIVMAIWKEIIFPILRMIVIGFIVYGDLPPFITDMSLFVDWVLGQALALIVEALTGIYICGDIGLEMIFALRNIAAPRWSPECTLSKLKQNWDNMVETGWKNFSLRMDNNSNAYGVTFAAMGSMFRNFSNMKGNLLSQYFMGNGMIGWTSCSPKGSTNCTTNTPGTFMTSKIVAQTTGGDMSAFSAPILADLLSLAGEAVDTVIQMAVNGLVLMGYRSITGAPY